MAHQCPTCSSKCHCGGDIDDMVFDNEETCWHCSLDESNVKDLEGDREFEFSEDEKFEFIEFTIKAKDHYSATKLAIYYHDAFLIYSREKKSTALNG